MNSLMERYRYYIEGKANWLEAEYWWLYSAPEATWWDRKKFKLVQVSWAFHNLVYVIITKGA